METKGGVSLHNSFVESNRLTPYFNNGYQSYLFQVSIKGIKNRVFILKDLG